MCCIVSFLQDSCQDLLQSKQCMLMILWWCNQFWFPKLLLRANGILVISPCHKICEYVSDSLEAYLMPSTEQEVLMPLRNLLFSILLILHGLLFNCLFPLSVKGHQCKFVVAFLLFILLFRISQHFFLFDFFFLFFFLLNLTCIFPFLRWAFSWDISIVS